MTIRRATLDAVETLRASWSAGRGRAALPVVAFVRSVDGDTALPRVLPFVVR